ncbi:Vps62-related protein [Micromonospora olivasterospora]|uniref:Vps62-related protein n=1 Tax=Micromonospora olivasterospora TaxID=1880 RepID=UPI0014792C86|nr:Vps62-related protein [Micromonospora olivasterospora]
MVESIRYGALDIAVIDRFLQRWDDDGSGAHMDGSFYNPDFGGGTLYAQGWRYLGSVGNTSAAGITGKKATILVRGANAADEMIKPPVRFDLIWNDRGSGAKRDGSVWRPIPPAGYVALGDVFADFSWNAPNPAYYACIRRELAGRRYVREGVIGSLIWNDRGSGSKSDVSIWEIRSPGYPSDNAERLLLGADLLRAHGSYDRPTDAVYVLDLPAVIAKQNPPAAPVLTSHAAPNPLETDKVTDRAVVVPCTLIKHPGKDVAWQVARSPFYTLERRVSFYCHKHYDNSQGSVEESAPQVVTTGVSKTKSDEFSQRTSVSVTASAGIAAKGFSASVETSFSIELGYTSRVDVTQFSEVQETWPMTVPPKKSAAMWSPRHEIIAIDKDGNTVGGLGGLVFDVNSRVKTEYPAPAQPQSLSEAIEAGDPQPFGQTESNIPEGF